MPGRVLEHEAAARESELVLAKVDVDANQGPAGEYGIRSIPAVKAFRNPRSPASSSARGRPPWTPSSSTS
jgi:thioredoxin-like negative regulator of GroEL